MELIAASPTPTKVTFTLGITGTQSFPLCDFPAPDVVVGFSQSMYMAIEGETAVSIGLSRRGTTNLPVTVVYSTQDNTATGQLGTIVSMQV